MCIWRSVVVAVVGFACSAERELATVESAATAEASIVCTSNLDCPEGQSCENYDCEGAWHCAAPGQGGDNCCTSQISCQPYYTCVGPVWVEELGGEYSYCLREENADCDVRLECGGDCQLAGDPGICTMRDNRCMCVTYI